MTKTTSKDFEWIPLKKVGTFTFGSSIEDYIEKYSLMHIPEEYNEAVDWAVYKINENDRVYAEGGRVVSVSCSSRCLYKKKNLIGISIDQIPLILGTTHDTVETEELSDGPQQVYEFDQLGLQLWVRKGRVVTAIFNAADQQLVDWGERANPSNKGMSKGG